MENRQIVGNTALISVIVPVYNNDKLLEICIDSILKQQYVPFEIIIIDDGSQQEYQNLYSRIVKKDNRIRLIRQNNQGVSSARNSGLKNAQGEFICFVDADDCLLNDVLAYQVNQFTPDIDCVCCGATKHFTHKNTKNTKVHVSPIKSSDYIKHQLYKKYASSENLKIFDSLPGYFDSSWMKMFRKEIIIKNNIIFNENTFLFEDSLFVLHYIFKSHNILLSSYIGYYYRVEETSATHTYSRKHILSEFTYARCLKELESSSLEEYKQFFQMKIHFFIQDVFLMDINNTDYRHNNLLFIHQTLKDEGLDNYLKVKAIHSSLSLRRMYLSFIFSFICTKHHKVIFQLKNMKNLYKKFQVFKNSLSC